MQGERVVDGDVNWDFGSFILEFDDWNLCPGQHDDVFHVMLLQQSIDLAKRLRWDVTLELKAQIKVPCLQCQP